MTAPKRALPVEADPVVAAFENAPLDPDALTADEAHALDDQLAKAEESGGGADLPYRRASDVTAEIASRSSREG
jgi:hypothetical protein